MSDTSSPATPNEPPPHEPVTQTNEEDEATAKPSVLEGGKAKLKSVISKITVLKSLSKSSLYAVGNDIFVPIEGVPPTDLRKRWACGTIVDVVKETTSEEGEAVTELKEVVVSIGGAAPIHVSGKQVHANRSRGWVETDDDLCSISDNHEATVMVSLARFAQGNKVRICAACGREALFINSMAPPPLFGIETAENIPEIFQRHLVILGDVQYEILQQAIAVKLISLNAETQLLRQRINYAIEVLKWLCGEEVVVEFTLFSNYEFNLRPYFWSTTGKNDWLVKGGGIIPAKITAAIETASLAPEATLSTVGDLVSGAAAFNNFPFTTMGLRGNQEAELTPIALKLGIPLKTITSLLFPPRTSVTSAALEEAKMTVISAAIAKIVLLLFRPVKSNAPIATSVLSVPRPSKGLFLEDFMKNLLWDYFPLLFAKKNSSISSAPQQEFEQEFKLLCSVVSCLESNASVSTDSLLNRLTDLHKETLPQGKGAAKSTIARGVARDRDSVFVRHPSLCGIYQQSKYTPGKWLSFVKCFALGPNSAPSISAQWQTLQTLLDAPFSVIAVCTPDVFEDGGPLFTFNSLIRSLYTYPILRMKLTDVMAFSCLAHSSESSTEEGKQEKKSFTDKEMEGKVVKVMEALALERCHFTVEKGFVSMTIRAQRTMWSKFMASFGKKLLLLQATFRGVQSQLVMRQREALRVLSVFSSAAQWKVSQLVFQQQQLATISQMIEEIQRNHRDKLCMKEKGGRYDIKTAESRELANILSQGTSFLKSLFEKLVINIQITELKSRQQVRDEHLKGLRGIFQWFEEHWVYERQIRARRRAEERRRRFELLTPLQTDENIGRCKLEAQCNREYEKLFAQLSEETKLARKIARRHQENAPMAKEEIQRHARKAVLAAACELQHTHRQLHETLYSQGHRYDVSYRSYWDAAPTASRFFEPQSAPRSAMLDATDATNFGEGV